MKGRSDKLVASTFQRRLLTALVLVALPGWHVAHADPPNLLFNGAFDVVGPLGPSVTVTGVAGPSAAKKWTVFQNTPSFITTELLPSTRVPGGTMIHVTTDGPGNGLVQVFGEVHTGPETVVACAWIFLVHGEVGIGTGDGGHTEVDMVLRKKGSWEVLQVSNAFSPANELIIYALDRITSPFDADNEFYVESAQVNRTRKRSPCSPQ
jgi:hypothetical protein